MRTLTIEQSIENAEKRGTTKQCIACAKRGVVSKMFLDKKEMWYKCERCTGVRPLDTAIPLYWNYCPNTWNDNNKVKLIKTCKNIYRFLKCKITNKTFKKLTFTTFCLYPKLITEEQKGIVQIKCINCGHIYTGA